MAEVTNELIYEVLKAIQIPLGNIEDALREHKGQIVAVRQDLHAVNSHISNIYDTTAAMDTRLSRIERRLEIIDTHVN